MPGRDLETGSWGGAGGCAALGFSLLTAGGSWPPTPILPAAMRRCPPYRTGQMTRKT
ncbi:hypothetical protein MUG91_G183n28 [Manis pentadactyla]|nr:hypothetical protein MUG91_G183n28 [Manis pentadactyla]